jgi:hypothetical protein
MPWLHEANPDINWKSLSISNPQFKSAKLAESVSASKEPPPEFQEFSEVFGKEFFTNLPPHQPYDCAILLKEGEEVPYGPIYPMTPWETEALKEYLENKEIAGKIRKSYSPGGAPVIFVEKADGSLHLVVDYHCLNNITVKDRHPLPVQEELIEKLKHAKMFTNLDLLSGYHNIGIKEGDEWETAFRTEFGHYEYTLMPFGLTNAPAWFQCLMNNISCDLLGIYVIVYLDNILIFSKSKEEHVGHVKEVLKQLQHNYLYCNPKKCNFFVDRVTYIGLVITPEGISMEKDKLQAVL